MSKLINKNPVLRFKLGLKILKFLWGSFILPNALRFIYETEAERPLYETGTVEYKDGKLRNKSTKELVDIYTKGVDFSNTNSLKMMTPSEELEYYKKLYEVKDSPITVTKRIPLVRKSDLVSSDFGNDMSSKFKTRGEAFNEARRLGLTLFNWRGKAFNTLKAGETRNAWRNTMSNNRNLILSIAFTPPTESAPMKPSEQQNPMIDAYNASKDNQIYSFAGRKLPEFNRGYYSNGTYHLDNPKWIKKAGIKDFNSLLNYINKNPNSNLALDLLHYYGGNFTKELFEKDTNSGGHYGRKNRKSINNFLSGLSQGFRDGYMDRVREYDKMYDLYKSGGTLVSKNSVKRFKQKKYKNEKKNF